MMLFYVVNINKLSVNFQTNNSVDVNKLINVDINKLINVVTTPDSTLGNTKNKTKQKSVEELMRE